MLRRRSEAGHPTPAQPRTIAGRFLAAMQAGDAAARQHWSAKLNGGKLGFPVDEAAVIQAACELAARRLWGGNCDVRDVTAAVTFHA